MYLINKALPPSNTPKVSAAIIYLNLKFFCKLFFLLNTSAANSCNMPNGHIVEQYNLPNNNVRTIIPTKSPSAIHEKSIIVLCKSAANCISKIFTGYITLQNARIDKIPMIPAIINRILYNFFIFSLSILLFYYIHH